jgi:hypothetical protein
MYDKWFGGGEHGVDDRFQWMSEDVIDLPFLVLKGVQNLRISEKSNHWCNSKAAEWVRFQNTKSMYMRAGQREIHFFICLTILA